MKTSGWLFGVAANRFWWHHTAVEQEEPPEQAICAGWLPDHGESMTTANDTMLASLVAPSVLLEMLFDRMPMGIAVIDRAYRIQRFNPTWQDYSDRYAPADGARLLPGVGYFEHLPGTESTVIPLFARVLAGEVVRQEDVRLELAGIVTYWDVTLAPLLEDGEVVGILNVTVDATERVLAQRYLEQRVEERTRELDRRREIAESLADILSILNSTRSSQEIFDYVTQRSCELLQADACLLYRIQENGILHEANYNLPEDLAAMKTGDLYRSQQNLTLLNRQPVAISDAVTHLQGLLARTDLSPYQRRWYQGLLASFQAYLGIPLIVNDQIFGGLVFYFRTRRAFCDEDIQLGQTLAGHAALAIENARLRHQAAEMATLAERSRLARDLHDAVTQTLFSASLIADVLPVLWERNPDMGRQKLDELRLLTRGAQSEMRTLLLELRPDTLADVELGDLCRHLANAFSGRTRVPVVFTQEGQAPLPPPVKEVCYRVAQEALNNIAKHANANRVQLHLNAQPDWVEVGIRDNGVGFDAAGLAPENLGLKIMRERAGTIGARLSIDSQPGRGTKVELAWRAEHQDATV